MKVIFEDEVLNMDFYERIYYRKSFSEEEYIICAVKSESNMLGTYENETKLTILKDETLAKEVTKELISHFVSDINFDLSKWIDDNVPEEDEEEKELTPFQYCCWTFYMFSVLVFFGYFLITCPLT